MSRQAISKNRPILAAVLLFLQLIHGRVTNSPSGLTKLIETQEQLVQNLAGHATEQYTRRIARVRTCTPSVHWCSDSLAQSTCSASFGTPPYCADGSGLKLNDTTSVFKTPPNVDLQQLPDSIKENVCVYRDIETFVASAQIAVRNDAWIYIGNALA